MSHLIQKGRTLSQNISASRLSRHKVMLAHKTMLRPAMKYPLCGTTFTAHECEIIDRSYFSTLLSNMGFNPMTKRLFFFGPPSLGYFGFKNNYTGQGISQVQMLLSHLRHKDEIGHMIQIMIENAQLAIGLSLRPLTYNPQVFIQYIESSWITSVWEFLHSIKGQAQLEDSWELGIQRVHNQNLMDIWTHSALNLAP